MQISGLQKNSTIDYPGQLSAVVFAQGCNFNCYYCQNRGLIKCVDLEDTDDILDENIVWEFLEKRRGLIDAVVISGGEATLQSNLISFINKVKSMGYKVKLDTNGSKPEVVSDLIKDKLVDFLALDYKAPFDMYSQIGADHSEKVRETMMLLRDESNSIEYEVRTTMIPEITPGLLYSMLLEYPNFKRYALQLYIPQDEYMQKSSLQGDSRKLYTPNDLHELAKKIIGIQSNTVVRA